jgi:hypothetical protein
MFSVICFSAGMELRPCIMSLAKVYNLTGKLFHGEDVSIHLAPSQYTVAGTSGLCDSCSPWDGGRALVHPHNLRVGVTHQAFHRDDESVKFSIQMWTHSARAVELAEAS